jgi:hypothetical protein
MYTLKSHDTRINNVFDRISKGKLLDEELRPYTRQFIDEIIQYFEIREDYEKCQTLKDTLESMDHEKNYNRWTSQSQMI